MFDPELLGVPSATSIKIAWIDLEENEAKRRMINRADPRDQWKLQHWDQYIQRRTEPPNHLAIQRFDNRYFDEDQFEKLIDHLIH